MDRVLGDSTAATQVTTHKFQPNYATGAATWSESNANYGPARYGTDTNGARCLIRRNLATEEDEFDCRGTPVTQTGEAAFQLLDASDVPGTRFLFIFTTSDTSGNTGVTSRMVVVMDTVAPTLLLNGRQLQDTDELVLDYWARNTERALLGDLVAYDERAFPDMRPAFTQMRYIDIEGDANTVSPSVYTINYTIRDTAGLKDGMFLVRTRGDMYALSLCADSQFEHHVLKSEGGSFTLNGNPLAKMCPTLPEVIALLSSQRDEQVAVQLTTPVGTATYNL